MKGRITLLHNGETVQTREYARDKEKNEIIEGWKTQYGKGYAKTTLKDEPIMPEVKEPKLKSRFTKGKAIGGQTYSLKKIIKAGKPDFGVWKNF